MRLRQAVTRVQAIVRSRRAREQYLRLREAAALLMNEDGKFIHPPGGGGGAGARIHI